MLEADDITILCPLCDGAIFYPSDREGEDVPCPHCFELIYLLSREIPDEPPSAQDLRPATVIVQPSTAPPPPESPAVKPASHEAVQLHAVTQQKVHSDIKRKAIIKKATRNPSATPPNRKKICPPESKVLKIPHLIPAITMDREGTKASPEMIFRHPDSFTLDRSGGGLRKKADVWECRWTAVHIQTDRHSKPWVSLRLNATKAQPGNSNGLHLKTGNKRFELATDAAWDRLREAKETPNEGSNLIEERFSFEHDDFRYLCGEIALNDSLELTVDGIPDPIDEDTCAEFREYTLEFFEALRREFPIFFR